ncbi:MAG: hypothetical protein ACJAQT_003424 [Akkermansiaceae bacterium]|jgi:hypothetical protein
MNTEPEIPLSRALLPEGCSDLGDVSKIRRADQEERSKFLLRTAATLHDSLVAELDPEVLRTKNPDLLLHRISDFLHPILLADPELERQIRPSSELVDTIFHVLMANLED